MSKIHVHDLSFSSFIIFLLFEWFNKKYIYYSWWFFLDCHPATLSFNLFYSSKLFSSSSMSSSETDSESLTMKSWSKSLSSSSWKMSPSNSSSSSSKFKTWFLFLMRICWMTCGGIPCWIWICTCAGRCVVYWSAFRDS